MVLVIAATAILAALFAAVGAAMTLLDDGEAERDRPAAALGGSIFVHAGSREVTRINEFDVTRDELVVLYDAAACPSPAVRVERQRGGRDAIVLFDGEPLAIVANGAALDPARIRLVGEAARAA